MFLLLATFDPGNEVGVFDDIGSWWYENPRVPKRTKENIWFGVYPIDETLI